jgi:hypothetical protein
VLEVDHHGVMAAGLRDAHDVGAAAGADAQHQHGLAGA